MRGVTIAPIALLATGLLAIAFPFVAFGVDVVTPSATTSTSMISLLQVFLALIIVLATIWGFAWLMRRFTAGQAGGVGALKVVGGVMVGPRERVVIVEVGDTWLLLGVAAGHVSLVHSLPRPADVPATTGATAGFSRALQRALRPGADRQ